MKAFIVRFASLYVFNTAVLWAIGALLPTVRVGWAALWAGLVLTAATLWIKPAVRSILQSASSSLSRGKEKAWEYGIAFAVALVVWIVVALFSGVHVNGFLWGYILPPIALIGAWALYDVVDDKLESKASELYDRVAAGTSNKAPQQQAQAPSPREQAATDAGRRELNDGLTDEQRRMLDEL